MSNYAQTFLDLTRSINILLGVYLAYRGYRTRKCVWVGLGYAMVAIDSLLIMEQIFTLRTLQLIRSISALIVGPYLLYTAGSDETLIRIIALLLIVTDGYLLLTQFSAM